MIFAGVPAAGGGVRTQNVLPMEVKFFPEGANQTFTVRDLVSLSSGRVVIAPTTGDLMGANDLILGKPLVGGNNNTARASIPVVIVNDWTEMQMPVFHPTANSARLAENLLGAKFEVANVTGGTLVIPSGGIQSFAVALHATTNVKVIVTGFAETDPSENVPGASGKAWNIIGEQYGKAYVKVIAAQRTLG